MKNRFEIRGEVTAIFLRRRKTRATLETLIDTKDLAVAQSMRLTWFAMWAPSAGTFYARNRIGVLLHRLIKPCDDTLDIDHRDHDGLNNRSSNLFPSTRSRNRLNQIRVQQGTESGMRGVSRAYKDNWRARVKLNGKSHFLGYFRRKEEASAVVEKFLLTTLGQQRIIQEVR